MKFSTLPVFLTLAAFSSAAMPADPAALASSVEAALAARDTGALVALVHSEGLSADDMNKAEAGFAGLLPPEGAGQVVVTADRLPDGRDIGKPQIAFGKRIEISAPPVGVIRVAYKEGRSSIVSTVPYVRTESGYLLAGRRTIDLGWMGPRDRQLGFTFADDYPPAQCAISIHFNASGVDIVDTFASHSGVVLGQRIDEFHITGLPETFKGCLVLREDGEEIFRSEPIVGRAEYIYRRSER